MNNLDWSNVEDEKDKRIRELEDTLRKQKELMEILQVLGKNESISKSCFVLREKCSWLRRRINQTPSQNRTRFQTYKSCLK